MRTFAELGHASKATLAFFAALNVLGIAFVLIHAMP